MTKMTFKEWAETRDVEPEQKQLISDLLKIRDNKRFGVEK